MSITCGFFNSVNGDRRYDAEQMSAIFDGIINDGVFAHVDGYFQTTAGTGMSVVVAPGRAWFNHTWTKNDSPMPLTIDPAEVILKRIDAVVLEVNSSDSVRNNTIKIVKGSPSSGSVKPTLINTDEVHQHALAYIDIQPGVTSITAENITIVVGQTECPFVTAILETTDITALLEKWEAEFRVWFDNVQAQLEGDIATNLQRQIDENWAKTWDATAAEAVGLSPESNPKDAFYVLGNLTPQIGDIKFTVDGDPGDSWLLCNGASVSRMDYPDLSMLTPRRVAFKEMTSYWKGVGSVGTFTDYHRLRYLNGYYIILGANNGTPCISFSTDLKSWTYKSLTELAGQNFYDIAYGNGVYVMVGAQSGVHNKMRSAWATDLNGRWSLAQDITFSTGAGLYANGQSDFASFVVDVLYANGYFVLAAFTRHPTNNRSYLSCAYCVDPRSDAWTQVLSDDLSYYMAYCVKVRYINGNYVLTYATSPGGSSPFCALQHTPDIANTPFSKITLKTTSNSSMNAHLTLCDIRFNGSEYIIASFIPGMKGVSLFHSSALSGPWSEIPTNTTLATSYDLPGAFFNYMDGVYVFGGPGRMSYSESLNGPWVAVDNPGTRRDSLFTDEKAIYMTYGSALSSTWLDLTMITLPEISLSSSVYAFIKAKKG